jgi:hypothetical protein
MSLPVPVEKGASPDYNDPMTFVEILERAVVSPFLHRHGPRKLLTGIVLSLFPVISFFAMGYIVKIFQNRLENQESWDLPEWHEKSRLFFLGLILLLTILCYTFIPFLVTSVSLALIGGGFWLLVPSLVLIVMASALWLLAVFMLPMAMALFLQTGEILSILDARMIFHSAGLILSRYFRLAIITLVGLLMISLPVQFSPFGYLVSAPLAFILGVFLASCYGEICRPALSLDQ